MSSPARRRRRRAHRDDVAAATPPRAVWPGVVGGRYRPLAPAEVEAVHETALHLLETLGLSQPIPSMVRRVTARGGTLDGDGRLRFPRRLVEACLAGVRRDVVLHGRGEGLALDLAGARVHMSTGGAAPNIVDLETGRYRPATTRDLYDAARLVDRLENVHQFSRSLVARDAGDGLAFDVSTAYACLAGTAKHVAFSISDPAHVPAVADLCYRVAGGEAEFRARPVATVLACHVVPPMRFAEDTCRTVEAAVRAGFPVQLISAGQAGATSPATVAGSLVQAVAETLAGLVHAWLVDDAARLVFAPKPLVADLRTGAMSGGGGEQAVLMAAAAQMGRHYGLPTSSIAGITDAKIPDAQHGAEKALAVALAAHAGANVVTQACGMQASLLGASLEGYVIDDDMLGAILRSVRGVEVDRETLAAEVVEEVCRGEGHYLGHPQTLARMRSDYLYPQISDRRPPDQWEADGALDARARARARARRILAEHHPRHIDEATDRAIRERHPVALSHADMGPTT